MIENGGTPPEDLPLADDIRDARKRLKQTAKALLKLDGAPDKKALPATTEEGWPSRTLRQRERRQHGRSLSS